MIKNSQQLKIERWVNNNAFNRRLKYNLKKGKIFKLRKWLYSKIPSAQLSAQDYLEAGSLIYSPTYLSFESVLQSAGIVFQYHAWLKFAWPYTHQISIWAQNIEYIRLPKALLIHPLGIIQKDSITQATPERAMCDILYHNKNYPFDRIPNTINKKLLKELATIYSKVRWQKDIPNIILWLLSK